MRLQSSMLGVCLLCLPAQAAEVSGILMDPSGAVITGGVVRLLCGKALPREAATTEEGRFRFETTEARCEISVVLPGFRPFRAQAGREMRLVLEIEAQRSQVAVQETVSSNADTVTLERQTIERLPVLGNDVLAAVAELLDAPALGSGGPSLVVDGMEGPMRKIPARLIQEVRINQSPYSAEYSRPGRGRIEVVTRKGEPEFHGALQFQIRDSAFDARNAFALVKPQEQRREWSGSLTGPLHAPSKTTFFSSIEGEAADEQTLVLARTPEGEIRRNWPVPERESEWNFGISRPLASGGSMTLRYEGEGESADNDGVGGFALPETGANSRGREHTLHYSHRAVFSPRWIAEFQARGGYESEQLASLLPGVPQVVVEDSFTAGGAQVDRLLTEVDLQLSAVLSWSRDRHVVKAGGNVPEWSREGWSDRSNRNGTWSFASLGDYLVGRPYSFRQQAGNARFSYAQAEFGLFLQHELKVQSGFSLSWGLRYDRQTLIRDGNNIAPRVSASLAVNRARTLVLRFGGGLFYDTASSGDWADVLRSDPALVRQVLLTNPAYPDPSAGGSVSAPRSSNVVRFSPDLRSPYLLHSSFGLEWRAGTKSTLSATYLGARGVKLFRSRDGNAPISGVRPDPELAILRLVESSAASASHAMELIWRGALSRYVDATVRYTLSRTRDNTGGLSWLPPDSRDVSREWARADHDQRHRFQVLASSSPWFGFELGLVVRLDSGRPYGLTTGRDENGDGRATDRPLGLGRNSEEGFGAARLDLRLAREFELGKWGDRGEPRMELRLDAFNVLNRVNLGVPVGNLRSPYFGSPVSAGAARRLQLSLEFSF